MYRESRWGETLDENMNHILQVPSKYDVGLCCTLLRLVLLLAMHFQSQTVCDGGFGPPGSTWL